MRNPASDPNMRIRSSDGSNVILGSEAINIAHPLAGVDFQRCNPAQRERSSIGAVQLEAADLVGLDREGVGGGGSGVRLSAPGLFRLGIMKRSFGVSRAFSSTQLTSPAHRARSLSPQASRPSP